MCFVKKNDQIRRTTIGLTKDCQNGIAGMHARRPGFWLEPFALDAAESYNEWILNGITRQRLPDKDEFTYVIRQRNCKQ